MMRNDGVRGWRVGLWKVGMLFIYRCWIWSDMLVFVFENDYFGVLRRRNWIGEDGCREFR